MCRAWSPSTVDRPSLPNTLISSKSYPEELRSSVKLYFDRQMGSTLATGGCFVWNAGFRLMCALLQLA